MSDAIEAAAKAIARRVGINEFDSLYEFHKEMYRGSARDAIAAYRDSEIEALRGQVAQHEANANRALAECQALVAKLADCQAVIRHKGHDKRCPANLCHFCGAAPEWKAHDDGSVGHAFIPRGPCSDACGHDRVVGHD